MCATQAMDTIAARCFLCALVLITFQNCVLHVCGTTMTAPRSLRFAHAHRHGRPLGPRKTGSWSNSHARTHTHIRAHTHAHTYSHAHTVHCVSLIAASCQRTFACKMHAPAEIVRGMRSHRCRVLYYTSYCVGACAHGMDMYTRCTRVYNMYAHNNKCKIINMCT